MKFETLLYKTLLVCFAALGILSLVGIDALTMSAAWKEDQFRNGQARYLMFAFAGLVTWVMCRCNPWWAIFWGYSFVLWVVTDWQSFGMLDIVLIAACLCVGDAIRCFYKPSDVARTIALLAVIQAVYAISQHFGFDPFLGYGTRNRIMAYGTIGQNTMLGAFVGLGFLICIGLKPTTRTRAVQLWIGAIICAIGVYVSHSSMAVLGTVAGYGYILWRRNPLAASALGALSLSGLALAWIRWPSLEFFGLSGREVVWPYVVRVWLDAPIFGHGPGYWAGALPTFGIEGTGKDRWYQAHNDFLQVLPEQGLVGLAIVLVGLFFFFRKARTMDPVYGAMAVALCVGALGNFLMHMVCFGLIAAWLATCAHHHKETPCKKKSASTSRG